MTMFKFSKSSHVSTCNKVLASGSPELKAWGEEVKTLRGKVKAQVQVDVTIYWYSGHGLVVMLLHVVDWSMLI